MPAKKTPTYQAFIEESTEGELGEKRVRGKNMMHPLICWMVALIIIGFIFNISYQVYQDVDITKDTLKKAAKSCLIDFQEKSCNPMQLQGECLGLFECLKEEDPSPILMLSSALGSATEEVKDDGPVPLIIVVILLLLQIALLMKRSLPANHKLD